MSRFAIRSTLAAVTFALAAGGLAGTAVAAPPEDGGMPHSMNRAEHMGGMRDGLWIPGLGPVGKKHVEQLKLDAKQQALFKTAQDSQRDLHKAMREAGVKRHELLKAQVDSGKLDPRALVAQSDQAREQFRGEAQKVRGNWLAVWDSLNDGQRAQVTQFYKERMAKMQERRERGEGHRGRPAAQGAPAAPAAPAAQ